MLGQQIASLHNLGFYVALMKEAAGRSSTGRSPTWKNALLPKLKTGLPVNKS
jgi:queuine/archaeosine tRNA-ribosyltransferase